MRGGDLQLATSGDRNLASDGCGRSRLLMAALELGVAPPSGSWWSRLMLVRPRGVAKAGHFLGWSISAFMEDDPRAGHESRPAALAMAPAQAAGRTCEHSQPPCGRGSWARRAGYGRSGSGSAGQLSTKDVPCRPVYLTAARSPLQKAVLAVTDVEPEQLPGGRPACCAPEPGASTADLRPWSRTADALDRPISGGRAAHELRGRLKKFRSQSCAGRTYLVMFCGICDTNHLRRAPCPVRNVRRAQSASGVACHGRRSQWLP